MIGVRPEGADGAAVHVIGGPARRWKSSFAAGKGCESLGFF